MSTGSKGQETAQNKRTGAVDRVSHAAENYLLSLYVLKEQGSRTNAALLAEHLRSVPAGEGLGTSLPSVLGMLRRLAREGLVQLTPQKEVRLTPSGTVHAESVMRRHRLAERMVVDLLGLELHKAHEEAHRLEHAISPELEIKIRAALGEPTTCPFGGPIPGSGYVAPPGERLTIDRASPGLTYVIDRVPEDSPDLLQFLVEKGILPERAVSIVDASLHRGVITVGTEMGESALGYAVAGRIWVRREA